MRIFSQNQVYMNNNQNNIQKNKSPNFKGNDNKIDVPISPATEYYKAGLGTFASSIIMGGCVGVLTQEFKSALENKFPAIINTPAKLGAAVAGALILLQLPLIKNNADRKIQEKTLDAETTAVLRTRIKNGDISDDLLASSMNVKAMRQMAAASANAGNGAALGYGLAGAGLGYGMASSSNSNSKK